MSIKCGCSRSPPPSHPPQALFLCWPTHTLAACIPLSSTLYRRYLLLLSLQFSLGHCYGCRCCCYCLLLMSLLPIQLPYHCSVSGRQSVSRSQSVHSNIVALLLAHVRRLSLNRQMDLFVCVCKLICTLDEPVVCV